MTIDKNIIVKKVGKIKEKPETRTKTYTSSGSYNSDSYGYGNRNVGKPIKEKDESEDIFKQSTKQENVQQLSLMFNNHFTKEDNLDLEDTILETELDLGFTLADLGFSKNNNFREVCGTCYHEIANFKSHLDIPICASCLEAECELIRGEIDDTNLYINMGMYYERF